MSIYISYHPFDRLLAGELLADLTNHGFSPKYLPLNHESITEIPFSKSDTLIIILRPEYIKSAFYNRLYNQISNANVLPVLRVPIAIEDWSENITLTPIIDFSNQGEDQFNLNILRQLLSSYAVNPEVPILNTKEIYINNLEPVLQEAFFLNVLLEQLNYEPNPAAETPLHALFNTIKFKSFPYYTSDYLNEGYYQEKTEYLVNIAKHQASVTLICDYLNSEQVAAFLVGVMRRQFIDSSGKTPIPLMFNVEDWDKTISWKMWLAQQLKINDIQLENITSEDLALYVYGFEHSSLKASLFQETFNKWWNFSSPAPRLIIVCNYWDSNSGKNSEGRNLIFRPVEFGLNQLKKVYTQYSNRPFAQFILDSIDNGENTSLVSYLLENPAFATVLLSVKFEDIEFSKQNVSYFFTQCVNNLWNLENDKSNMDFSAISDALSKVAAILIERKKLFISHDEILKFVQLDTVLSKCINQGLLLLKDKKLRFSSYIIQDYFASIALMKYGLPSQLPSLTLTSLYDRIPQRWDNSLIILSHITPSYDNIVRLISDIDPLLALRCLTSGTTLRTTLYSYVIDKNIDALSNLGDFRLQFAKLLYKINSIAAKEVFVEVLRNARWSVRMHAYSIFLDLYQFSMVGLLDYLKDINDDTRVKVSHAIRRIGSNTFPTLFQLLKDDNVTTRLGAIWAISELKDRACVPALVMTLGDNNLLVVIQAIETLGKLHDVQSVPYLAHCLQYRYSNIRKVAVNALVEIENKESNGFVEIVRQMDAVLRRLIVLYLSTSQKTTLLDFLLAFSYDEDVDVKVASIEGLATMAEPRAISRLKECLEDMSKSRLSKASVGEIVSKLLSNISGHKEEVFTRDKDQNAFRSSSNKSLNSSQIVKSRLLNAKEQQTSLKPLESAISRDGQLERLTHGLDVPKENDVLLLPEDTYVSDILSQLRSGKWNTSNNAAKILREYVKTLGDNTNLQVINQILETLNDDNWVIRWTGVETLGWVGNIHVVPHLIQRLTDSNWKVRIAAIRALVEIKEDKATIAISKLVSDNNSLVREAAAEALGYLDSSQSIPSLETAALDSEEFVRLAAVESLGKTRSKVATRSLLSALKDSSEHVRWAAANSLTGIADAKLVAELKPSLSDYGGPYWEQKRICDVIVDILKQIDTEEAKNAILQWQSNQS